MGKISKILFIGTADALKTNIILEIFMNLIKETHLYYNIFFLTDNKIGKCSDFCYLNNIEVIIDESHFMNLQIISKLHDEQFDLLISIGYPYKIPMEILSIFKYAINCHGSILPDYRGNRAYMHYWANCEDYYGASIHFMNEEFDDGKVIIQGTIKAYPEETQHIFHRRISELCGYLLPTAIFLIEQGFEGYYPNGLKRYFYKLTADEFSKYHLENMEKKASGVQICYTPHKFLK